jgi:hypothetical protein
MKNVFFLYLLSLSFLFFNNTFCFLVCRSLRLFFHLFLIVHSLLISCFILFHYFFPLSVPSFFTFFSFSILFLTVPLPEFFLLLYILKWHVWVRRWEYIGSWWGNRRENDQWGDLGVDGWIILGCISRRWDVGIWTGLGWPRIETGGGRL